jgi:hypothetical protein
MLPFIQCHQTRGRALAGGFSKLLLRESGFVCGAAANGRARASVSREPDTKQLGMVEFMISELQRLFAEVDRRLELAEDRD